MGVRSQSQEGKKIARERIEILCARALEIQGRDPAWSRQYILLARRISTRQRIRIPREFRRRFCRKCNNPLVPGVTQRVRIHRGKVIATCLTCGRQKRYPVVKSHRK